MAQETLPNPIKLSQEPEKALRILAKSRFKELQGQGFTSREILTFATELVSLVTDQIANPKRSKTAR